MDVINQRRILNGAAGVFTAGAVAALLWSFAPLQSPASVDSSSPLTRLPKTQLPAAADSQNERTDLRALRRPLYDPPPKPVQRPQPVRPKPVSRPPRPAAKPKLEMTLVGTIIDKEGRLAIVADSHGAFDVKSVGESLDLQPTGVTVKQIDSEQVTLSYQGNETTFTLDKKIKPSKPARANNRRVRK